jgi:phosphoribosylformimino-5-aminoimidazole carboxamide ribotide isomerase
MKIVPAIDILRDRLVRLVRGKEEHKTDYIINPVKAAQEFRNQGAEILHIIDLSATLGKGDSTSIILNIRKEIDLPLQVGGGLRTYDRAAYLLDRGVEQVILGTIVVEQPDILHKLLSE